MIKRFVPSSECGPLLGLFLLGLAAAGPASAQEARDEHWRGDLEYLGTQLEARHPDLYHSLSPAAFRGELEAIADRVSSLSEDGVALALARLLARVGDGHTLVPLMWDRSLGYRRLPVVEAVDRNAPIRRADAYLDLGREREAERLLCEAFLIDPQFDRALDRELECGSARRAPAGAGAR